MFDNFGHSMHIEIFVHMILPIGTYYIHMTCMHVLVRLRTYVQEKSALRQDVVQVQLQSRWR